MPSIPPPSSSIPLPVAPTASSPPLFHFPCAEGIPYISQQHQQVICHSKHAKHALDPPSLWRTPTAATTLASSSTTTTFNHTIYSNLPADIAARVAALLPLFRPM